MADAVTEDLPGYREPGISVENNGAIGVLQQRHSASSMGLEPKAAGGRLWERHFAIGRALEVARLPLGDGDRKAVSEFLHVIGHLLRKPGIFVGCRCPEKQFPAPSYRVAYDHLAPAGTEADRWEEDGQKSNPSQGRWRYEPVNRFGRNR